MTNKQRVQQFFRFTKHQQEVYLDNLLQENETLKDKLDAMETMCEQYALELEKGK